MGYHIVTLIVPFLLLYTLTGCAINKPAPAKNIYIEDLNGIHTNAGLQEFPVGSPQKNLSSKALHNTGIAQVKILKKTSQEVVFETTAEGTCSKYERQIDAEKRAEDEALARVVKEAGVDVYSGMQDTMAQYGNTSYQFIGKYLNVWSNALVSYEKTEPAVCTTSEDITHCLVKIRGKVYYKGTPDPNFEIKAELNKPAYFNGDDINLKIDISKDAYITILSCDEDGDITVLYPNRYDPSNFLSAGKEMSVPKDRTFSLKAILPEGRTGTAEVIHIIATKKQPLLPPTAYQEDTGSGFATYSLGGIKNLMDRLSKLDRPDWGAKMLIYEIKPKP